MNKSPWDFETESEQKKHKSLGARVRNFFRRNSVSTGITENTGPNKKAVKSTPRISNFVLAGALLAFIAFDGNNVYHSMEVKQRNRVEQTVIHDFAQGAEAITNLANRILKPDPQTTIEQQVEDFAKTMKAGEIQFQNVIKEMKLDNSTTAVALTKALGKASTEGEYKDLGKAGNVARLKGLLDIGRLENKLFKEYLIKENVILDSKTENSLYETEQAYKAIAPGV